jgi:hypothetical protein
MRIRSACTFKETIAIALLGCLIGTAYGSVTAPGAAKSEQTPLVTVNRVNKGDQLPSISTSTLNRKTAPSPAMSSASAKRPPLGCDRAFSQFADPVRANIYKRCAA